VHETITNALVYAAQGFAADFVRSAYGTVLSSSRVDALL
jgi:hypothetical protein